MKAKLVEQIMDRFRNVTDELSCLVIKTEAVDRALSKMDSRDRLINDQAETIKRQNKIISDLINNIYSQDTSLEAVMIKPYRGKPAIYKDGKQISTDRMTGFDIDWSYDSHIDISVRNE